MVKLVPLQLFSALTFFKILYPSNTAYLMYEPSSLKFVIQSSRLNLILISSCNITSRRWKMALPSNMLFFITR
ncbi:hypothetical protein RDI58_000723 [Solanum bulbocastanum]|uniref:Uncharacterized protein n=1 Tax=Solanum bulbocastanum TaxID=147425 RepID=A0AAN8U3N5_SOLBU